MIENAPHTGTELPQESTEHCRSCGSVILRAAQLASIEPGFELDLPPPASGKGEPGMTISAGIEDEVKRFRQALKKVDTDGHSEAAMVIRLLAAAEERRAASGEAAPMTNSEP